jgi:DNA-binding transcriptional ArsR family regulator
MKFTRRKFLGTTLAGSLAVGARARAESSGALPNPGSAALDIDQRASLRAAMDEIIPANEGMPAASEVGGIEYLDRVRREEPQIAADLKQALDALERLSQSRFRAPFAKLSSPKRVEVLSALEAGSPEVFGKLRDHIYESYYTQPKVWKLIGYEFYPTNESGPHMKPFDESVLAKVRQMPKLYRQVNEG